MMRFPVQALAAVVMLSLLFIGCPDKDARTDVSADTSVGETGQVATDDGAEVPRPSVGGNPGAVNVIPFSGDKEKIRQKMSMIAGAEVRSDTAAATGAAISYRGGRFAGFPVIDWTFLFYEGQMMFAQVNYGEEDAGVGADSMYTAVTDLLNRQYGQPVIDSKNMWSRPLSAYSEQAQEFLAKIGKSLPQDFRIWTAAEDARYVITLNKVQWNTAGGQTYVHLGFYVRDLSERHFAETGE